MIQIESFFKLEAKFGDNKLFKETVDTAFHPFLSEKAIQILKSNPSLSILFSINSSNAWTINDIDAEFIASLFDDENFETSRVNRALHHTSNSTSLHRL